MARKNYGPEDDRLTEAERLTLPSNPNRVKVDNLCELLTKSAPLPLNRDSARFVVTIPKTTPHPQRQPKSFVNTEVAKNVVAPNGIT